MKRRIEKIEKGKRKKKEKEKEKAREKCFFAQIIFRGIETLFELDPKFMSPGWPDQL